MGMTLWIHTLQDRDMSHESDDHTLMHDLSDELDLLCERLGVAKLSSFFDLTDLQYNFGDEDAEEGDEAVGDAAPDQDESKVDPETGYAYGIDDMQWFDAGSGLATLEALRDEVESGAGANLHLDEDEQEVLLEELDDCIAQLAEMAASGGRFHLSVVM